MLIYVWLISTVFIQFALASFAELSAEEIVRLKQDVENLKAQLKSTTERTERMEVTYRRSGHATYIRWGRNACHGNASTIYRGHAAGPHFTLGGGGSNLLCVHEMPQWTAFSRENTRIYGVEFRYPDAMSTVNHGGVSLHGFPAPCAVCNVPRETVLMIPGRLDCPPGYAKEYQGFIFAEYTGGDSRHRTEYLCWDHEPESASGGTQQTQSVTYPVAVGCGSLPCSRFHDGRSLTCVVCSK